MDVKITIPELADVRPFWVRDCPDHLTLAELYQDCVNHPDVRRSRQALERVSRHFWAGERFLRRADSLHSLDARTEISLVLRRDLYRIGPRAALSANSEYAHVDAEDRIDRVVALILSKTEKPCCFDLRDWRGRRLAPDKSLAAHELWPAWEEADTFPDRAVLRLRARTGWLAYALLGIALLAGMGAGYWLWLALAARSASA